MNFSSGRTGKTEWDPEAHGSCLPTPEQEALLGAALFPLPAATDSWQRWRAQVDPARDTIDPGSHRLLPLAWYNLRASGLDDPFLDSIRRHFRHTIAFNQIQLHGCAQLLARLHRAGIATLALKGAALITDYYPDVGLRPIGDFDVLVRHAQAEAALDILDADGWRGGKARDEITPHLLQVRHAENFVHPTGRQFDLHWYALAGSMDADLDGELWEMARPLTIHSVPTYTLCPTDQLLHICVHGAAWASMPPIRWIPDAVMVLRGPEPIDWERLVRLAQTYALTLPLHHTLDYLQTHILPQLAPAEDGTQLTIPGTVLATLAQTPTTAATRRLFRAHTQRSSTWGQLPLLWARYRAYRARRQRQGAGASLNFLQYVAIYYGYRGVPAVLRWAVVRSLQRMGKLGGRLLSQTAEDQPRDKT